MSEELGFGEFIFRKKIGEKISKATNVTELAENIKTIPDESLKFHSSKNHISNWLSTRGEFDLAQKFRKIRQDEFKSIKDRKKYYLKLLSKKTERITKASIVEFSKEINDFSYL